jgi:segregation and condensation protein A
MSSIESSIETSEVIISTSPESNEEGLTEQQQPALAKVNGETLFNLPQDLYIPPDALEVFLETFEGPLDLLLYLIKKQNLDIVNIPIAEITRQYIEYMELMQELQIELAGEYLLMAAMLAEIKSRMLLPRPVNAEAEEEDPRAELVRRLQEYERYKQAAVALDALPRLERDIFQVEPDTEALKFVKPLPQVDLKELLMALKDVFERVKLNASHQIQAEVLSIRERMTIVLNKIKTDSFTVFSELFTVEEGRMGVVVTFIAILELLRQSMIEMVQAEPFAPIHVKAIAA